MSNLVGGTYRDNGFAVTLEQFSLLALEIGVPGTWVSVLGRNFGVNGRAVTDLVKLESFLFVSRNFAEGEKSPRKKKSADVSKVCRFVCTQTLSTLPVQLEQGCAVHAKCKPPPLQPPANILKKIHREVIDTRFLLHPKMNDYKNCINMLYLIKVILSCS